MHFKAVAHAQGHTASIHPAPMASEAVAMAEAVGHSPLPLLSHHSPEGAPAGLSVEIGGNRITSAVSTCQGWQLDQPCFPSLQQVPLLKDALIVHQRQWMHPSRQGIAPAAPLLVVAPPDRAPCGWVSLDFEEQEFNRAKAKL